MSDPESIDAKFANAIEIIAGLEWSGQREGQGAYMGDSGTPYPCCPLCDGIKPGEVAEREFYKTAIGHKRTCSLRKMLKDHAAQSGPSRQVAA